VTHLISLREQHVHGDCPGLGAGAIEPAWQLCNLGVELFYMLHKLLTHADVLGFLEHVCDVVPLLLSRIVGKHSENVEHHTVIK
jgi:hypothetical protein